MERQDDIYGKEERLERRNGAVGDLGGLLGMTYRHRRDEFERILVCDRPAEALEWIREAGVMSLFIPELEDTYSMVQNKYHRGTVWEHTLNVVEHVPNSLTLRMAALLHDIGKVRTRTFDGKGGVHFYGHEFVSAQMSGVILKRWGYPDWFVKKVKIFVSNHMRTKSWGDDCSRMQDKSLRKMEYELGENFYDCLSLIHADNISHAQEYCLPCQVSGILRRVDELERDGENMFNYRLPISEEEVGRMLKNDLPEETRACVKWLLKFAFSNPKVSREMLVSNIKRYRK